jgi:hypothetical protein
MLRDCRRTWSRAGRMRMPAVFCAVIALMLTAPVAVRAAAWRAFSDTSPWNLTAAPAAPANPYASQFAGSAGFTMKLSGTPDNPAYASPIYFAQPGDPVAPAKMTTDWGAQGTTRWNGQGIPAPAGVSPAPGSDGHLTVVSADRRTAWEFWRCTQAGPGGYTAAVIVQFDLTGPGYSDQHGDNSARGSGTPLISTTLRAEEALNGVNHALGITVPSVSSVYIYPPASHSDGGDGPGGIQYGMRFVLRPDYVPPPNASVGVRNVVQALQTFGAYVVDQGADFEMDADSTHPELWRQAGLSVDSFNFTATDFRPATPGPPAPLAKSAAKAPKPRHAVVLRANKHALWLGGQLRLRGRVRSAVTSGMRVRVQVRTRGHHWRRLRRKPVEANGAFSTWPRLGRGARVSRHGHRTLRFRDLRVSRRAKVLRIRALVKGVGRSRTIKVRIHVHRAKRGHHKRR